MGGATPGFTLAVSDPDAPLASTFAALNIDGDELIHVTGASGDVKLDYTIDGLTAASGNDMLFGGFYSSFFSGGMREISGWNGSNLESFAFLNLVPLQEHDFGYGTFMDGGDTADHVWLARWSRSNSGMVGYQLIGTPAASIPTMGVAIFRGDALGVFTPAAPIGPVDEYHFLSRAGVEVDFSRSSGAVRGGFEYVGYSSGTPAPFPQLDFSFTGDLNGTGFESTSLSFPFITGTPSGSVFGQFYGSGAGLETGGAFNIDIAGIGQVTGGFTAGLTDKAAKPLAFTPGATTQAARWAVIFADPGDTTKGAADVIAGAGNSIAYSANGFVDNDDRFTTNARVTDGGGGFLNIASPDFTVANYRNWLGELFYLAVERPYDGGTDTAQAETWGTGSNVLRRLPLVIQRNDRWRYAVFSHPLEYQALRSGGVFGNTRHHLFATFGQVTPSASIPASGSARYVGTAAGLWQDLSAGETLRLQGDVRLNVNFSAATIDGVMGNFYSQGVGGFGLPNANRVGEIAFSAPLQQRFASANIVLRSSSDPAGLNFTGSVFGEVYGIDGEAAAEIGGGFALSDPGVANFAGVFVTGRNAMRGVQRTGAQSFSGGAAAANFLVSTAPLSSLSMTWTRRTPEAWDDSMTLAYVRGGIPYAGTAIDWTRKARSVAPSDPDAPLGSVREASGVDTGVVPALSLRVIEAVSGYDLNYAGVISAYPTGAPASFIAFGQRTANMPTTGTAEYNGAAVGAYRAGGVEYQYDGVFRMEADFGSGDVSGATYMVPTAPGTPASLDPDFGFAGSISGSGFSTGFTTADGNLTGTIAGVFAGPNAEEVVGTFATGTSGGRSYEGGFGARR